MASQITDTINSILTKLAAIPFDWNSYLSSVSNGLIKATDMPDATKLYQSLEEWNGQTRKGRGGIATRPNAYIQLVPGPAMNMGMGVSLYPKFIVKVHIVDTQLDGFNEAGGLSGSDIRIGGLGQNLEIFKWRDLTKTALETFFPLHCGAMTQTEEYPDDEHDDVYHYVIEFLTSFSDLQGSILNPDQTSVILQPSPNVYNPAATYTTGNQVLFDNVAYVCTTNTPSPAGAFDATLWIIYQWGLAETINITN